jgi:hypothetical protein
MKIQDFRTALKDDEVKSLFVDIFNDKIEQCVHSVTTALLADFNANFLKKFDKLNINFLSLKAEVQRKDTTIGLLNTENQHLKASMQALSTKMDESEAFQRRENLIITGLEVRAADRAGSTTDQLAQSSTSLTQKVTEFCNNILNCHVEPTDISTAHLLPIRGATAATTLPAVMVRFVRRSVRDDVFSARRTLKTYTAPAGHKIYINEDLTAANRKILAILRMKVRNHIIMGAWSQSGRVMAKDLRGGIPKHITTLAEANSFS